jgi:DNA-binding Lrp family transcriptional regulator
VLALVVADSQKEGFDCAATFELPADSPRLGPLQVPIALYRQAPGYSDTVIVQLTLNSHTDRMIEELGEALEEIPEMLEAYLASGAYDHMVRIVVRATRSYRRAIERLACCAQRPPSS